MGEWDAQLFKNIRVLTCLKARLLRAIEREKRVRKDVPTVVGFSGDKGE